MSAVLPEYSSVNASESGSVAVAEILTFSLEFSAVLVTTALAIGLLGAVFVMAMLLEKLNSLPVLSIVLAFIT